MKQLNLIGFFATVIMLGVGCCKEPEPCNPSYFADLTIKEKQGVEYTLLIDNAPVTSWKGDTTSQVRTIDISERYTGNPADFRIRATIDLKGPNIDAVNYYSDVYRDSVRVPGPPKVELTDQTGSGTIWVERIGGRNKIKVRNSLRCASEARLVYNGRDTTLSLGTGSTENGTDYLFETTDSTFNITFQLLTPCEFYLNHEVMKVSSSSIKPFDFDIKIAVRKEGCDNIQK